MRSERNVPEKRRTKSRVLLHDNAPAHWAFSVKDFLSKKNVTTLEPPPYSPDTAAGDFYLFPRLKSTLKGRHFCDAIDIIKNATKELKRKVSNNFTVAGPSAYLHKGIN
jgi:transposase